jgi:outer membrane protein TolC
MIPARAFILLAAIGLLGLPVTTGAQPSNAPYPIDLPTTLKLAGARNLDIQIAQEQLVDTKARYSAAVARFFPWIAPGITLRRHDDKLQDVQGNIIDVDKYSYAPGVSLAAEVNLGDALYTSLAAKQLIKAADHAVDIQRQESVLTAALAYFDLAFARGSAGVARESVRINADYEDQLRQAVDAGIAFKGDALRVAVQRQRSELSLRQAAEQQRVHAARLAQLLHLDPAVELLAEETDLAPLTLIETNSALDVIVQRSLASRPELKQSQALIVASRDTKNGAAYGPLLPSVGAQAFFGGLGGGRRGVPDSFGAQEDYLFGLNWRLGPGGLFDFTRTRSAESGLRLAALNHEKLRDELTRQAVAAFARWQSLSDQLSSARAALNAAEEGLRLAQQRKEFAVGVVLETIQAEQDLTRARLDYLKTIAELNKAQYELLRIMGRL